MCGRSLVVNTTQNNRILVKNDHPGIVKIVKTASRPTKSHQTVRGVVEEGTTILQSSVVETDGKSRPVDGQMAPK